MSLKVLSAFPYFGGKAKMASWICERLEYQNTAIYIEPYGGGARVLLNKKRHHKEIYNELNVGVRTFFTMMSIKDDAHTLIDSIYRTEYNPTELYNAMSLLGEANDDFIVELKRQAFQYLGFMEDKYRNDEITALRKAIRYERIDEIHTAYKLLINGGIFNQEETTLLKRYYKGFCEYLDIADGIIKDSFDKSLSAAFDEFKNHAYLQLEAERLNIDDAVYHDLKKKIDALTYDALTKDEQKELHDLAMDDAKHDVYMVTSNKLDDIRISDIDLATATYVLFTQSIDGMGKTWSTKFRSTDHYQSQINRLYDVADRMEGVHTCQVDAEDLIRIHKDNPKVMMYLDPSYLKPGDELKNLGKSYQASYSYADHERLLQLIHDAKCKIAISNYDVDLYNRYLKDWNKYEYETVTTVKGTSKGDNRRVEILWTNY